MRVPRDRIAGAYVEDGISYPESDGKPMADNTKQFDWISHIKWGLEAYYQDDPDVFVAGDLLWYPLKGSPKVRTAPDALVAFGRPKGPRGSYIQWRENNIAPQVVFEVLSPGNRRPAMKTKFEFYERYGVEEYYIYDPDRIVLQGWQRREEQLEPIAQMRGWISPRLQIRFELNPELELYTPTNEPLLGYLEIYGQKKQAEQQLLRLTAEKDQSDERARQEGRRAEQEHLRAEQQEQRAEQEHLRAERLAALLKEAGINYEE